MVLNPGLEATGLGRSWNPPCREAFPAAFPVLEAKVLGWSWNPALELTGLDGLGTLGRNQATGLGWFWNPGLETTGL